MFGKVKKVLGLIALSLSPFAAYASSNQAIEAELVEEQTSDSQVIRSIDNCYELQESENYGGVAAAVITSNVLLEEENLDQTSFFNARVRTIVEPSIVRARGMELDEVDASLQSQGLKTDIIYQVTMTGEELGAIIEESLENPDCMIIAQYDQSYVDMHQGVIYGIIVGYDKSSHEVKMMNMHPKQKKFTSLKVSYLLKAMQALNSDHCPRGFILATPMPSES